MVGLAGAVVVAGAGDHEAGVAGGGPQLRRARRGRRGRGGRPRRRRARARRARPSSSGVSTVPAPPAPRVGDDGDPTGVAHQGEGRRRGRRRSGRRSRGGPRRATRRRPGRGRARRPCAPARRRRAVGRATPWVPTSSTVRSMPGALRAAIIAGARSSRPATIRASSATSPGWVGVGLVGEQVHAGAAVAGADLDPAHQLGAELGRGRRRLGPPGGGVVVGERDDVEAGLGRPSDDLARRLGAVARRRVGVEVDAHPPDARGCPSRAGRRCARPAGSPAPRW